MIQTDVHDCKWWCSRKQVFAIACISNWVFPQPGSHWFLNPRIELSTVPDFTICQFLADFLHALHLSLFPNFHSLVIWSEFFIRVPSLLVAAHHVVQYFSLARGCPVVFDNSAHAVDHHFSPLCIIVLLHVCLSELA